MNERNQILMEGFRNNSEVYFEAKRQLYIHFIDLLIDCKQLDLWTMPYFISRFANGEPDMDGNPIFSAINLEKSKIVNIILDDGSLGIASECYCSRNEDIDMLVCTTIFSANAIDETFGMIKDFISGIK